jgi:hypothetical protein
MFARREFLKFVLGSAVVVGLPWKRFEWREPTFAEIVRETLRRNPDRLLESLRKSNLLFARLAEKHSRG